MARAAKRRRSTLTEHQRRNLSETAGWQERLVDYIKERGMSQRGLAGASGLGATTVRYLVSDAETLSLDTAREISNALNIPVKFLLTGERIILDTDGDLGEQRIKVIGVSSSYDPVDKVPTGEHGVVAIKVSDAKAHMKAFKMQDASMHERGQNESISPDAVVANGDIVVWSKDEEWGAGSLVVVSEVYSKGKRLTVRRLTLNDSGDMQASANDVDFGRVNVKPSDVLGAVVFVQRSLQ